ncbi:hypothetical protein GE21DRAFT_1267668 [Neurospora crassa]|nr:hypothetical protein GE21DRAFT_1267668 [Neurospora crassa]
MQRSAGNMAFHCCVCVCLSLKLFLTATAARTVRVRIDPWGKESQLAAPISSKIQPINRKTDGT